VSRCGISAPYPTGISKTVEKSWVKCKYSLRVYDEHVHVERLHISSYARQRSRRGLSESLRFLEKSTTPDPASGRPIVSVGRATDSYEFGWCWINPGHGCYRSTRYTRHPAKLANVQRTFILAKIPFVRIECKFICGIPLAMTF